MKCVKCRKDLGNSTKCACGFDLKSTPVLFTASLPDSVLHEVKSLASVPQSTPTEKPKLLQPLQNPFSWEVESIIWDGRPYLGDVCDCKPHGLGVTYDENGRVMVSAWRRGSVDKKLSAFRDTFQGKGDIEFKMQFYEMFYPAFSLTDVSPVEKVALVGQIAFRYRAYMKQAVHQVPAERLEQESVRATRKFIDELIHDWLLGLGKYLPKEADIRSGKFIAQIREKKARAAATGGDFAESPESSSAPELEKPNTPPAKQGSGYTSKAQAAKPGPEHKASSPPEALNPLPKAHEPAPPKKAAPREPLQNPFSWKVERIIWDEQPYLGDVRGRKPHGLGVTYDKNGRAVVLVWRRGIVDKALSDFRDAMQGKSGVRFDDAFLSAFSLADLSSEKKSALTYQIAWRYNTYMNDAQKERGQQGSEFATHQFIDELIHDWLWEIGNYLPTETSIRNGTFGAQVRADLQTPKPKKKIWLHLLVILIVAVLLLYIVSAKQPAQAESEISIEFSGDLSGTMEQYGVPLHVLNADKFESFPLEWTEKPEKME